MGFKNYRVYWQRWQGHDHRSSPINNEFNPTNIFVKGRNPKEAMKKANKIFLGGGLRNCSMIVKQEPSA